LASTGDHTEIGRISEMISAAQSLETPLTRQIKIFGHKLLILISGLAGLVLALGLWRGESLDAILSSAIALAVGAIPEGLPVAVTVTLAIGVSRMARRRAIIRKLPAVETLGSTTVICTDKTGTLTQSQEQSCWDKLSRTAKASFPHLDILFWRLQWLHHWRRFDDRSYAMGQLSCPI
jgi:Ca2+-transporting ATPase